jgi:hypothetical protein
MATATSHGADPKQKERRDPKASPTSSGTFKLWLTCYFNLNTATKCGDIISVAWTLEKSSDWHLVALARVQETVL